MKIIILILITLGYGCGAANEKKQSFKDMGRHMMDLKIYQENLGDYLEEGRFNDAAWLLDGLDSILLVVSDEFPEHRKLKRAFYYFYKKDLSEPVSEIRNAIQSKNRVQAVQSYRILVNKCNGCHADHDVNKDVFY